MENEWGQNNKWVDWWSFYSEKWKRLKGSVKAQGVCQNVSEQSSSQEWLLTHMQNNKQMKTWHFFENASFVVSYKILRFKEVTYLVYQTCRLLKSFFKLLWKFLEAVYVYPITLCWHPAEKKRQRVSGHEGYLWVLVSGCTPCVCLRRSTLTNSVGVSGMGVRFYWTKAMSNSVSLKLFVGGVEDWGQQELTDKPFLCQSVKAPLCLSQVFSLCFPCPSHYEKFDLMISFSTKQSKASPSFKACLFPSVPHMDSATPFY